MYAISARGGLFISSDAGSQLDCSSWNRLYAIFLSCFLVCIDFLTMIRLYIWVQGSRLLLYRFRSLGNPWMVGIHSRKHLSIQNDLWIWSWIQQIIMWLSRLPMVEFTNIQWRDYMDCKRHPMSIQFDDLKKKKMIHPGFFLLQQMHLNYIVHWTLVKHGLKSLPGIYIPSGFEVVPVVVLQSAPADSNVVYFAMVVKGGINF